MTERAKRKKAKTAVLVDEDESSEKCLVRESTEYDAFAITNWAITRRRKLPSCKYDIVHDKSYDPLAYIVCKYIALPQACDRQMDMFAFRNRLILEYKNHCRDKASGVLKLYAPLLAGREDMPDTCKMLIEDLEFFFMSDHKKMTMSLCIFPSVFAHRELLTPSFFSSKDWQEKVRYTVRRLPNYETRRKYVHLLMPDTKWDIGKSKPFDNQILETKIRQEIILQVRSVDVKVANAIDISFTQDTGREMLFDSARKQFILLASFIDSFIDLLNFGEYVYSEELDNEDSADTVKRLGLLSTEIKKTFNITTSV